MLGLGSYESSDDEAGTLPMKHQTASKSQSTATQPESTKTPSESTNGSTQRAMSPLDPATAPSDSGLPIPTESALMEGPPAGPSAAPDIQPVSATDHTSAPQSPYSLSRSIARTLTMPRAPKFDIPPSPPGSPPAGLSVKFARFLELKKRGVHFNEKLEKSSLLRNPSLLNNLMDFAEIAEEEQYATTLPDEVAPQTKFAASAYADQLARTQQEVLRKREDEQRKTQREAVDFVHATVSDQVTKAKKVNIMMIELH
ncbi:hypothetical protein K490DRAFT_69034 [Saccharata proteae CBS 121410]|uniref:HCNGP-like protein-domain-containing protein n=1 Tax=Saccharata proteae CBS 121410 TaxID=1314787 RepID=A0A9P4LUK8_9PEZI|nr:hypothetical protein K490DRAFT_69034 [Saccharata proteae CBS 121410]